MMKKYHFIDDLIFIFILINLFKNIFNFSSIDDIQYHISFRYATRWLGIHIP